MHPRFLYRYRPVSQYSLQEIAFNSVYFCPFEKLNDPREGGFRFEASDPEVLRNALAERARADGEPEIADTIGRLDATVMAELEKLMATLGMPHLETRTTDEPWGVVCFTERYDNPQMWANYADQNRGFVIEYDTAGIEIPPGALLKVRYEHAAGAVDMHSVLTKPGGYSETLAVKDPGWAGEEEWRLLARTIGKVQLLIPISRVITGLYTSHEDRTRIVNTLQQRGSGRFAQVVQAGPGREFRLHDLAGP